MYVSLRKIDNDVSDRNKACEIRRKYIENKLSIELENLGKHILDFNELVGKNIENPIGAVQIPVGIAGPLPIEGETVRDEVFIPLATTEGALVAGVNRGCSLVKKSKTKVVTRIIDDKMTRAPVFKFRSVKDAILFVNFIFDNIEILRTIAKVKSDDLFKKIKGGMDLNDITEVFKSNSVAVSRYTKLLNVKPVIVGNTVFVELSFNTGDAMGMNMVTIASNYISKWLVMNSPVEANLVGISGNFCVDKKPNAKSLHRGRGKTVIAEVVVKKEYVKEIMRTDPETLMELNMKKNLIGSAISGSLGFNAHFANIIAAIFLATGQDLAHVSEASVGLTNVEQTAEGDLYVSVYIPDLPVGTVGGGTRLPTARECLKILGCEGSGNPPGTNAKRLAEIISAAILVGEINLLSSIATNELAKAHQSLGR